MCARMIPLPPADTSGRSIERLYRIWQEIPKMVNEFPRRSRQAILRSNGRLMGSPSKGQNMNECQGHTVNDEEPRGAKNQCHAGGRITTYTLHLHNS